MLIGICGLAGSGKDTVGEYLVERYDFFQYAFADPLRQAAAIMFGLTDEQMLDRELKNRALEGWGGKSPRQLLQLLGTEAGRDIFGPDLWTKAAERNIGDKLGYCDYVITDVRFDSEATWIKAHGGVIVRLYRSKTDTTSSHSSENGISSEFVDHMLFNDGTTQDLFDRVDLLIQKIQTSTPE